MYKLLATRAVIALALWVVLSAQSGAAGLLDGKALMV